MPSCLPTSWLPRPLKRLVTCTQGSNFGSESTPKAGALYNSLPGLLMVWLCRTGLEQDKIDTMSHHVEQ